MNKSVTEFTSISNELIALINEWEKILSSLSDEIIARRRNSQNRTIKQIVGHMIDSATNNTHRTVHLQYQESPFHFPNYATFGNNDRWISIQNYQEENWNDLIQLWKYSNLHFAYIIQNIDAEKLHNEWVASAEKNISLKNMVSDFPRHFKLHLDEINELINR